MDSPIIRKIKPRHCSNFDTTGFAPLIPFSIFIHFVNESICAITDSFVIIDQSLSNEGVGVIEISRCITPWFTLLLQNCIRR